MTASGGWAIPDLPASGAAPLAPSGPASGILLTADDGGHAAGTEVLVAAQAEVTHAARVAQPAVANHVADLGGWIGGRVGGGRWVSVAGGEARTTGAAGSVQPDVSLRRPGHWTAWTEKGQQVDSVRRLVRGRRGQTRCLTPNSRQKPSRCRPWQRPCRPPRGLAADNGRGAGGSTHSGIPVTTQRQSPHVASVPPSLAPHPQ
jgi:hypothetical protein